MANDHSDDSKRDFSPEEMLKPTKIDAAHKGVRTALATVPVLGGLAAEIFDSLIIAPVSKRRDEFLIIVYEGLKRLEEKYDDFSIEGLAENETFQSTVIQATQAAVRTHQKEKLKALRNAILNSALPKSANDSRYELFIRLIDELTVVHMSILSEVQWMNISYLDLENPNWKILGKGLTELGDSIEAIYPELADEFDLCIEILDDLYRRGLIANKIPAKNRATFTYDKPMPTPFAKAFLEFLKSPLDD